MSVTHVFSIFPSASDGGWPHEIPSLLTHLSFLSSSKWEIFMSVIIPELQKYSLSHTNIWSIWNLLHCCSQIISVLGTNYLRKTKSSIFCCCRQYTKMDKWWLEIQKEKQVRKILWRIQRKKNCWKQSYSKEKYLSLKKTIFLSHEKLS